MGSIKGELLQLFTIFQSLSQLKYLLYLINNNVEKAEGSIHVSQKEFLVLIRRITEQFFTSPQPILNEL